MHLFNLFKPFSVSSSSHDAQSGGETEIDVPEPSTSSSRKRRRLKRRVTKQSATGWQSTEATSLSNTRLPDVANEGFRSAPNLLDESSRPLEDAQSRSWSPIPTLQRHSVASPSSRLRENFSDGSSWTSYERNISPIDSPQYVEPPLDRPLPESMVESPLFGPREQGLFRDEMPYDMNVNSPLSQLASGWRDTPRHIPRRLPDPPVRDVHAAPEMLSRQEMASLHSKDLPPEWRHSPESKPMRRRAASPESRRNSEPIVYIIPGGMKVVFQDEDGNEITRVGDFSERRRPASPIIVQDEYGRELYRTSDIRRGEPNRRRSRRDEEGYRSPADNPRSRSAEPFGSHLLDSERSYGRNESPTVVLIDRRGRLIPILPLASE
ncbi:hypothetical protein C8F04DRAFT_8353 [Mycena alexandri]|uniref:Uncharacterized protein n=1 Tax=Mycena alexandri TaxID=1745969 RepID=A0AAD6XCK8_9AGAR|nr:hypothetical protein C8F04DRAFT_8353 [Mycena alexandri]